VFYDGISVQGTIGAHYDWDSKTCHALNLQAAHVKRLFEMYWKGFELPPLYQQFLRDKKEFGWPVKPSFRRAFEHHFPYLVDDVPLEMQDTVLFIVHKLCYVVRHEQHHFAHIAIKTFHTNTYVEDAPLVFDENESGAAYATTCSVCKPITRTTGFQMFKIKSKYCLQLEDVRFCMSASNLAKLWLNAAQLSYLDQVVVQMNEQHAYFKKEHAVIKDHHASLQLHTMIEQCKYFCDGLPVDPPNPETTFDRVRVLLRPGHFYSNATCVYKFRWYITHVFWTSLHQNQCKTIPDMKPCHDDMPLQKQEDDEELSIVFD